MRVSKWWLNFHFWVNYPFKCERFAHHSRISSGNKAVAHYSVMTHMFFEWMPTLFVPCSMLLLKRPLLGGSHNKWSYTVTTYKTDFVKKATRDPEGERKGGETERRRRGERERNGTGCASLLVVWGNKGDVVDAAQRPALLRPTSTAHWAISCFWPEIFI